jgi:ABC-type Mn2+/Zn2+ transport system ATPase subunit
LSQKEAGTTLASLRSLSVRYKRNEPVLEGVSFEICAGEFWSFLGPNGAGKTSLLEILLGNLRPREGRVELHPELASRARLGVVPQHCRLNQSLPTTVREFVLLGLLGLRLGRGEERERLSWALGRVGLAERRDRDYWSLSGGQRQRALVARALVRRPSFLVLDEPTVGLDLAARERLLGSLDALNRDDGLTILFVTHDISAAARHASHVALFGERGVRAGRRSDLLTAANVEWCFGVPGEGLVGKADMEGGCHAR